MSKKMMIFYSFPINFSLKILNDRDLNDRTLFGGLKMIMTLHDRILGRNKKNDRSPHIEVSGRFCFMAEYAYYNKVDSGSFIPCSSLLRA